MTLQKPIEMRSGQGIQGAESVNTISRALHTVHAVAHVWQ